MPRWLRWLLWTVAIVATVVAVTAYVLAAITVLPPWVVGLGHPDPKDPRLLDAITNTRGALLGLLAPVAVVIGGVAALLNYRATTAQNRATLEVQRRGQVTERFTRAIEQLCDGKLTIRIGAVYALEQIAKDSKELHWPIMEVLTAHLREQRPYHGPSSDGSVPDATVRPPADHQAIATVIGRRQAHKDGLHRLDLNRTDLGGFVWSGARLVLADLRNADLRGAKLRGADLRGADLRGADLLGADLLGADLLGADLRATALAGADFYQAKLCGAQLSGADLSQTDLRRADLSGADLRGTNLKQATLDGADIAGTDLRGAVVDEVQIDSAITANTLLLMYWQSAEASGDFKPFVPRLDADVAERLNRLRGSKSQTPSDNSAGAEV